MSIDLFVELASGNGVPVKKCEMCSKSSVVSLRKYMMNVKTSPAITKFSLVRTQGHAQPNTKSLI